jgi:hypothetical protein
MSTYENDQSKGLYDYDAFMEAINDILKRRQAELKCGTPRRMFFKDWDRTWTLNELRDTTFHMRRVKRPPSRSTIMDIADYAECDLDERNRLLILTEHMPFVPLLGGSELKRLVEHVRPRMEYLPFPAYIVNRDWRILAMNQYMYSFFDFTQDLIDAVPVEHLNVLRLVFDPNLPIRSQLGGSWEAAARRNIYGFKKENVLCQFELWYQEHVVELMSLPDFSEIWEDVDVDHYLAEEPNNPYLPFYITYRKTPYGDLKFQSLVISLGNEDYPQIVAYVPVDDRDQILFAKLGLPTPPWTG